jgi:hypothetical protein
VTDAPPRPQAVLTALITAAISHEDQAHRYIRRWCRTCADFDARILRAIAACRSWREDDR